MVFQLPYIVTKGRVNLGFALKFHVNADGLHRFEIHVVTCPCCNCHVSKCPLALALQDGTVMSLHNITITVM